MIRSISSKDKTNFLVYTEKHNSDFYIVDNNKRFYLSNKDTSLKVFNYCLKHGGKCLIQENSGIIEGIAIFIKEDNIKYLKILAEDLKIIDNLLKCFLWNNKTDFYVRVKNNNFFYKICNSFKYKYNEQKNFGFKFEKSIKREVLFRYIAKK